MAIADEQAANLPERLPWTTLRSMQRRSAHSFITLPSGSPALSTLTYTQLHLHGPLFSNGPTTGARQGRCRNGKFRGSAIGLGCGPHGRRVRQRCGGRRDTGIDTVPVRGSGVGGGQSVSPARGPRGANQGSVTCTWGADSPLPPDAIATFCRARVRSQVPPSFGSGGPSRRDLAMFVYCMGFSDRLRGFRTVRCRPVLLADRGCLLALWLHAWRQGLLGTACPLCRLVDPVSQQASSRPLSREHWPKSNEAIRITNPSRLCS